MSLCVQPSPGSGRIRLLHLDDITLLGFSALQCCLGDVSCQWERPLPGVSRFQINRLIETKFGARDEILTPGKGTKLIAIASGVSSAQYEVAAFVFSLHFLLSRVSEKNL